VKYIKIINIAILAIVSIASAGIVMTTQTQNLEKPKEQPFIQNTYLEKDMIRMDMKAEKSDMATIFRGDKELFWMIDHKKKTYTEMTKEDLEKIQKAAEELMAKMQDAMKNLPKGMQGIMPGAEKKSEIIYKKVASGEKVNQWTCDKYEGTRDGKKEVEIWTSDWKKLGLKAENLNGFERMGNFFSSMLKGMSWYYKAGTDEKTTSMYVGFPVKTVSYTKDKAVSQYEIKEIKEQELNSTMFDAPEGYKKEKFESDKK
jgi:hypothetical protein